MLASFLKLVPDRFPHSAKVKHFTSTQGRSSGYDFVNRSREAGASFVFPGTPPRSGYARADQRSAPQQAPEGKLDSANKTGHKEPIEQGEPAEQAMQWENHALQETQ